jgi:hypothetical protein
MMQFTGETPLVRKVAGGRWRGAINRLVNCSVHEGILKGECNDT